MLTPLTYDTGLVNPVFLPRPRVVTSLARMKAAVPRESTGFTSEIKFVVDSAVGRRIQAWARERLAADPHGAGPSGDEYRVTSLYFDTADRDVFHRRGSYGRSKYRIRRYHHEPTVFLERKLRTAVRLAKRRTMIELTSLPLLTVGDPVDGNGTTWFRRRLELRRLAPVCQVSYVRMARGGETLDGPARLTLDHALVARLTDTFSFEPPAGMPLLGDEMILELKYQGTAPAVFKHLVEEFALEPRRASKYRVAAGALGLVRETTEGEAPHTLHA